MRYKCVLIAMGLTGCVPTNGGVPAATANFQFSNAAGLGTQNAGLYGPGALFLWNIKTNKLEPLETLTLEPRERAPNPADLRSESVGGIEVTGLPASLAGMTGAVEARIGAKSAFSATGTYREDYRNTIGAISDYVRALVAQGQDPDLILHPRDDDFRLVIVKSVVRAQASSLSIGGTDASDPDKVVDVSLDSPLGELAALRVRVGTSATCGAPDGTTPAEPPVCFFNVSVLDPLYKEGNPLMQFEQGGAVPEGMLPAAFRRIN